MNNTSLILVSAFVALVAPGVSVADPVVTVVMSGLDNPRGLAFDSQGALYVAEAGRGGYGDPKPPWTVVNGLTFYYGETGAISRLWKGKQKRVVTGLPSAAQASGRNAIGANDIAILGGSAYVTIGLRTDPANRDSAPPEFAPLGRLVRVPLGGKGTGKWRSVADLAAYEQEEVEQGRDPDGGGADSNPYGLLAPPARKGHAWRGHGTLAWLLAHRGGQVVTDAGGNTLLHVAPHGAISQLAVFPSRGTGRSTDSVPTSVTLGPDGAYYVGELTGNPFPDGAANVYRVVPGHTSEVCLTGFKTIIDLDFDEEGNLYVLEHSSGPAPLVGPGRLWRVSFDGHGCPGPADPEAGTRTTVMDGLALPTSVAVGPDGALYVTNKATSPGIGEVLRIEPEP